jgi:hypothetical protein
VPTAPVEALIHAFSVGLLVCTHGNGAVVPSAFLVLHHWQQKVQTVPPWFVLQTTQKLL